MATMNSGLGGPAGYGENVFSSSGKVGGGNTDDGSVLVDITSVFSGGLEFFGATYTEIYISANGIITFGGNYDSWNFGGLDDINVPALAPFFSDIDINGGGEIYWDLDTTNGKVTITWDDVKQYGGSSDNSFQVVLTDLGDGQFDVEFIYQDISFTTVNGEVAATGFTDGSGTTYEMEGSGNSNVLAGYESNNFDGGDPNGVFSFETLHGIPEPIFVESTSIGNNMGLGFIDLDGDIISNAADYVSGGAGDDTIDGEQGSDLILGGDGADSIVGGDTGGSVSWTQVNNGANFQGTTSQDYFEWTAPSGGNATIRFNNSARSGDGDNIADYVLISNTNDNAGLTIGDFDMGTDKIVLQENHTGISTSGGSGFYDVTITYAGGNQQYFTIYTDDGYFDASQVFTTTQPGSGPDLDTIYGGDGNDTIGEWGNGGNGDDLIFGEAGNDSLTGGQGNDTLDGGADNDWLSGGAGNDEIYGGLGYDFISVSDDHDITNLWGGEGDGANDTVGFYNYTTTQGVVVTFTGNEAGTYDYVGTSASGTFAEIEAVDGGYYDDTIDASATTTGTTIRGQSGDDDITGGSGADTIHGGGGDDYIEGGDGDDVFVYGGGADTISDFNLGNSGALGDGDTTNNDFIDLSNYYDALSEVRADFDDDGILNQSAGGDYGNNAQKASGEGITFTGASRESFTTDNTGVACFASGTMIRTPNGEVSVECLKPGDLVQTRDHGPLPVRLVACRVLYPPDLEAVPALRPIEIRAGAFGQKRSLVVSPQHALLLTNEGQEQLVRARQLAKMKGGAVRVMAGRRHVTYVHLVFDAHQIVFANDIPSESFFPGPDAVRGLEPAARTELDTLFPGIARTVSRRQSETFYGPAAHRYARRSQLPRHVAELSIR